MINSKNVVWLTLLVVAAISPVTYIGYTMYQKNHFSCQAEVVISKNNTYYTTLMNYHFDGGTGTLEASGSFKRDGVEIDKINKKLSFNYWRKGDSIIMVSSNKYDDKESVALLNTFTPDFYLYSDRGLTIQLKRQNASSYLFVQSDTPLFSCMINKS